MTSVSHSEGSVHEWYVFSRDRTRSTSSVNAIKFKLGCSALCHRCLENLAVLAHDQSETPNVSFVSQQGREMMTQLHVLIQCFFDKVHVVLPLVYTVDVLPQPDMLLIGLSNIALRHRLVAHKLHQ